MYSIEKIFNDSVISKKVQTKLPYLFQIAELENSRAGKVGMQVGSVREDIIIGMLVYVFGEDYVNTNFPITEKEIDVELLSYPISIKTVTSSRIAGVKLIWTVDRKKVLEFREKYKPTCDMIYIHINWFGVDGGLFFVPLFVQNKVLKLFGKQKYIKLPPQGTNPRGVEISNEAMTEIINQPETLRLPIKWIKQKIEFKPYERWVDLWRED